MSLNYTLDIPATWMDNLLDTAGSVVQATTNKATRIFCFTPNRSTHPRSPPPPPHTHTNTPNIKVLEVGLSLRPLFKVWDWTDWWAFDPDQASLSQHCNNTIITEKDSAVAVLNPLDDTQSDTQPTYS